MKKSYKRKKKWISSINKVILANKDISKNPF